MKLTLLRLLGDDPKRGTVALQRHLLLGTGCMDTNMDT